MSYNNKHACQDIIFITPLRERRISSGWGHRLIFLSSIPTCPHQIVSIVAQITNRWISAGLIILSKILDTFYDSFRYIKWFRHVRPPVQSQMSFIHILGFRTSRYSHYEVLPGIVHYQWPFLRGYKNTTPETFL